MRWRILASALGGVALIALIVWFGSAEIGSDVLKASWAIPAIVVLHLLQIVLAGGAWMIAVGSSHLTLATFARLRLVREGINSLLPVAQVGGQIVCIRWMTQQGAGLALVSAGTVLDQTIETGTQFIFAILGTAMLAEIGINPSSLPWVDGALFVSALGIVAFIAAQRIGLLKVIEWAMLRLNDFLPLASAESFRGMHDELMRLQGRTSALITACSVHLLAWALGSVEVYLVLLAMGAPVSVPQAFVVESLGMAARSAGFAVPGALGVQEGGFILVCGLFGVPPGAAIALSMVKRLREILFGIPGLMIWQWSEIRRRFGHASRRKPPRARRETA